MNLENSNNEFEDQSFRDSIATIDKEGKRTWIYPLKPSGKYYNLRTYFTLVYIIVFFSLPFIKYHDEPLFLLDVVNKKFILFQVEFASETNKTKIKLKVNKLMCL